jgi:hypothetical protein
MTWKLDDQSAAVEQALAAGVPQHVGWFRFYFEDERWEWSVPSACTATSPAR